MKKLALILAITTAIPAHAGGPVITEEEPIVAGDYAEDRVNPLWIVGGLVVACLILCGGGDDDPAPVAPPVDTPKPPAPEPQPDPGPKPCVYEGGGC
jgi:hypothetical protein